MFLLLLVVAVVFFFLVRFMCKAPTVGPAYVPEKLCGNRPFAEQNKIQEIQRYYEALVACDPLNRFDPLEAQPGDSKLAAYEVFLTFKKLVKVCRNSGGFFRILSKLYLQTPEGTEVVECVLVHESGIFVFKTMLCRGNIYGDVLQPEWVQVEEATPDELFPESRFDNPIGPVKGNVGAVKGVLGEDFECPSFVVFGDDCKLADVPEGVAGCKILRRQDLEWALSVELAKARRLTIAQVDAMYKKLNSSMSLSSKV